MCNMNGPNHKHRSYNYSKGHAFLHLSISAKLLEQGAAVGRARFEEHEVEDRCHEQWASQSGSASRGLSREGQQAGERVADHANGIRGCDAEGFSRAQVMNRVGRKAVAMGRRVA